MIGIVKAEITSCLGQLNGRETLEGGLSRNWLENRQRDWAVRESQN